MAYQHINSKGQNYFLHRREVTLRGGRKQVIHFFSRDIKDGAIEEMPEGFKIEENSRTGMPLLKRKR